MPVNLSPSSLHFRSSFSAPVVASSPLILPEPDQMNFLPSKKEAVSVQLQGVLAGVPGEARAELGRFREVLFGESSQSGLDKVSAETVANALSVISNWENLNGVDRARYGVEAALGLLEDFDVVSKEEASRYSVLAENVAVLVSEEAADIKQAEAVTNLLGPILDYLFDDEPHVYATQSIVGLAITSNGEKGYLLENGEVVGQSATKLSNYPQAAVQVAAILLSEQSDEQKAMQLSLIGVDVAKQANLLSSDGAAGLVGVAGGAINIASAVKNWDKMSDESRAVALLSGSNAVIEGLSKAGVVSAGQSFLNTVVSGLSSVVGTVTGALQSVRLADLLGELHRSVASKVGALSGAAVGLSTGAALGSIVPGLGTILGAGAGFIVGGIAGAIGGAFGSGKGKGQKLRDGWRDSLQEAGIAQKISGSHHVKLADGTDYNIGVDGDNKLVNTDGAMRHYFEADHSNPIVSDLIPSAHLIAIATGVDPSNDGMGLFNNVVGILVNAATSNTAELGVAKRNLRALIPEVSAEQIIARVEVLRVQNKLTEEEYHVYMHHMGQLFGAEFRTSSRKEVTEAITSSVLADGAISKEEYETFGLLFDETKYQQSLEDLNDRLARVRSA